MRDFLQSALGNEIFVQAAFNRYLKISDRNNYIKQNHQFIKKRILKNVLNIN